LLLVGSSPGLDEIARQLPHPPVLVANLFQAIGEITVAPTGQPIKAVLVASSFARHLTPQAIAALRRLDPTVLMLLIAEQSDEMRSLPAQAFDECLTAPVDATRLASVIDELPPAEAPPMVQPDAQQPSVPAPPDDPTQEPIRASATVLPTHQPAPPAPPACQTHLGDTDLVEAALHDPLGMGPVAVRLARQQTGWDDLVFLGPEEPTPSGTCAMAEVRYGESCFGRLMTGQAGPDALEPWAQWLARWLALDRSFRNYRIQAVKDDLTGAWNRRFFHSFLHESIVEAREQRRPVTVMVFDIDNFKQYNDQFGHEAGDVILIETVRLLNSTIRRGDRVCRIGGDEFAVIFADPEGPRAVGSRHPLRVEEIAKRFQDQICRMQFPKLGIDAPGTLSISGGLSTFPWDGTDCESLLRHADRLAMQSKRVGKNVITFGPGAASGADDEEACPAPNPDP
jgi:diguanylate cyclase (GGDEF)-like protein